MKLTVKIFFVLLFSSLSAFSQNVKTGLPFLKTGVSAQTLAMGETFSCFSLETGALVYNPAVLASFTHNEISLSHKALFAETSTDYLGSVIVSEPFSYGFSLNTTSIRNIELRTQPGPAEGMFDARNFSFGFSTAAKLNEDFSLGVTAKFLYEKIFIDEASGYGIDVGGMYSLSNTIALSLAVNNFGSMDALHTSATTLPTTLRAGGSYFLTLNEQFSAVGNAELVKTLDDKLTHFHLGTEVAFEKNFALRLGYLTGYEARGFSAGFGVQYAFVKFNYAYVPMTNSFTSGHIFTLGFLL